MTVVYEDNHVIIVNKSSSEIVQGDKTELSIHITANDWNAAYAGEYSDTVTFTVSYEDK